MRAARIAIPAALIAAFVSCAPSRLVKPLKKGENAVTANFGGPLIHFSGAVIPMPFTAAGYARGMTDGTSVFANLHTTSLLFGNVQVDAGAVFRLYERPGAWGVSTGPALQVAWSARHATGFRAWPSIDVNAYFHPGKKSDFIYAGANAWFEALAKRPHDEPRKRALLPNLHAGYAWVRSRWRHQAELRLLGAGIPNLPGVVEYFGVSGKGALGLYYGVVRTF